MHFDYLIIISRVNFKNSSCDDFYQRRQAICEQTKLSADEYDKYSTMDLYKLYINVGIDVKTDGENAKSGNAENIIKMHKL